MELTSYQNTQKSLYITPWMHYRKEQDCYLADGEEIEAYLPFMDLPGHLRDNHNKPLWHLLIQDSIKDILTKSVRSNNPISVARATMDALKKLKDPEIVSKVRGKTKEEE